MKRILCLILSVLFILAALSACNNNNDASPTEAAKKHDYGNPMSHPLYIRAQSDCESVVATFKNSQMALSDIPVLDMEKIEDEGETAIYRCYQDAADFDRVVVTVDGKDSDELAYNEFTSGRELYPGRELPFTYGKESGEPEYDRQQFPYDNRTKDVLIRTPADYDPKSSEKYAVIYMTDGHNLFDPHATSTGSWAVAESVDAMMSQSDNKAIIVGIENIDGWRDDELTPNLGAPTEESYADGHGAYFCDFVVDTVMPYIEENYNVYTDREHTVICGSSSGGIESFYIAMEHPEKFGAVGALSPAFELFDSNTWKKYLKEKDFSAGYPFVYLYCGGGDELEKWLRSGFDEMPENLTSVGYPAVSIYSAYNEKAVHNELYWRIVFPDFLKYAVKLPVVK